MLKNSAEVRDIQARSGFFEHLAGFTNVKRLLASNILEVSWYVLAIWILHHFTIQHPANKKGKWCINDTL